MPNALVALAQAVSCLSCLTGPDNVLHAGAPALFSGAVRLAEGHQPHTVPGTLGSVRCKGLAAQTGREPPRGWSRVGQSTGGDRHPPHSRRIDKHVNRRTGFIWSHRAS